MSQTTTTRPEEVTEMTNNRKTLFARANEASRLVNELADWDAQFPMTEKDAFRRRVVLNHFICEAEKMLRADR